MMAVLLMTMALNSKAWLLPAIIGLMTPPNLSHRQATCVESRIGPQGEKLPGMDLAAGRPPSFRQLRALGVPGVRGL